MRIGHKIIMIVLVCRTRFTDATDKEVVLTCSADKWEGNKLAIYLVKISRAERSRNVRRTAGLGLTHDRI
jgi:hypothetical protein